jgi:hypothetical protein
MTKQDLQISGVCLYFVPQQQQQQQEIDTQGR